MWHSVAKKLQMRSCNDEKWSQNGWKWLNRGVCDVLTRCMAVLQNNYEVLLLGHMCNAWYVKLVNGSNCNDKQW